VPHAQRVVVVGAIDALVRIFFRLVVFFVLVVSDVNGRAGDTSVTPPEPHDTR
jgi:hypothetical protein